MDRQNSQNVQQRGRPVSSVDAAKANDVFEQFLSATTVKSIYAAYRALCDLLHLKPNVFPLFYPKLRANLTSWKAKALWKKFDLRAAHKCYARGKACPNTRVLVIGAGPCGLRTAIEAQFLGAKVVVVEKRDRISRNNVLHLWPFVIEDLRALGAKKFFGKFCAGAIDHISIRQLQVILLKVALLIGVEVHTEISFVGLVEPNSAEKIGWRAECKPSTHPVNQYEFDVIIGADGKRNTLTGFSRKEFRGKLAIAITANFINKRTEAEARVEEISGVAFIFNQKFFKDLNAETGIDLENIVYYKDDTHYFVMTAKKPSLIEKGVIQQDFPDTLRLLGPENVDKEALLNYAREAADFSTNYQMPNLEFAVNHYGQPDVAMFDFTSMYAAESASRFIERSSYKLLVILVGDSLLEPFWPTGSGCARGFLSSLDACWAIRSWGSGTVTPLEVLAERESIYRLLAQTTPENLNKDCKAYTLDPSTRYPNLNKGVLLPQQVLSLYDTDEPSSIELISRNPQIVPLIESHRKRRKREAHVDPATLLNWIKDQVKDYENLAVNDITLSLKDGRVLCAILHHYRPDLLDYNAIKPEEVAKNNQLAFDLLEKEIGISPVMTGEELAKLDIPDFLTMVSYLTQIYDAFRGEIPHIKHPKLDLADIKQNDGETIKHIEKNTPATTSARPSSRHKRQVDTVTASKPSLVTDRKPRKRRTLERMCASMENRENQKLAKGEKDEEIATRIKNLEEKWQGTAPAEKKPRDLMRAIGKIENTDWNIKEIEKKIIQNKMGKNVNKEKERVPKWSREQFLARQNKMESKHLDRQDSGEAKFTELDKSIKHLEQRLKEGSVRDLGQNKVASMTEKFGTRSTPEVEKPPIQKSNSKTAVVLPTQGVSEYCHFCSKRVYLMEKLSAEGRFFHRGCFKCQYCHASLRLGSYLFDRDGLYGYRFYCAQHFGMPGELHLTAEQRNAQKLAKELSKATEQSTVTGVDLLDRVQTPERVKFANLSTAHVSDHEESLSQMDEDEWTDRNFGASTAELGSSDDDSSSLSDTESDDEEPFEEALEEPATKEGTLRWMERCKQRYSREHTGEDSDSDGYSSSCDHSSYYENSSEDDESETATEGEEEIRARELRKQEVRLEPPVVQTDTGSDTENLSEESSTEISIGQNSATEISTDSEFAQDDPTPTREIPSIAINDFHVTKTRGTYAVPKKVQVKSGVLQKPTNNRVHKNQDIELKLTPLISETVVPPLLRKPAPSLLGRSDGYALNRTQSTSGIATKVSLELKKKYLLGDNGLSGNIQKSGSASALDSKFKSFHSNISDCQKLLKPAPEISPSMQVFCNKLNERMSPTLSPIESFKSLTSPKEESKCLEIIDLTISPRESKTLEIIDLTISPKNSITPEPKSEIQQPDITKDTEKTIKSPVQEASIVLPQIWTEQNKKFESDSFSDSLTSNSDSDNGVVRSPTVKIFENIPRFEIHDDVGQILPDSEDVMMDSLYVESANLKNSQKSISSEKKSLNQPKTLPDLKTDISLKEMCDDFELKKTPENETDTKTSSGRSTPSNNEELAMAALTETELSDWAREGTVSDDLEDAQFEFNPEFGNVSRHKKPKLVKKAKTPDGFHINSLEDFDEISHVCDKKNLPVTENVLECNLDSIEYMDTGAETSSDDNMLLETLNPNIEYMKLNNEDDIAEDSLSPSINNVTEAVNPQIRDVSSGIKNTGYCIFDNEDDFGGKITDLRASDLQKMKEKSSGEHDEDSLVFIDTGTTTEDNTCSDSTVKNLTEKIQENKGKFNAQALIRDNQNLLKKIKNLQKSYEEQYIQPDKNCIVKPVDLIKQSHLVELTKKEEKLKDNIENIQDLNNIEFQEHCQRLQSKVEFGNVRDSIDIRKSKRKDRFDLPPKPDLIQEEKEQFSPVKTVEKVTFSPVTKSPRTIYNKEEIRKERDENQKLIQEMVMNKLKAQNKSLERKKRNRNSFSPSRPFELNKSATTDIASQLNMKNETEKRNSGIYVTPDVLLPAQLKKSSTAIIQQVQTDSTPSKSKSSLKLETPKSIAPVFNSPDQNPFTEEFKTPKAPPRIKNEEARKTAEKMKQTARAKAKLLSDEELGLSPEDKLKKLREKILFKDKDNEVQDSIESLVLNTERRNSWLYSNDTLSKKRNNSFKRSKSGDSTENVFRTKSVSELPKEFSLAKSDDRVGHVNEEKSKHLFKSDPNLLSEADAKRNKKKKDRDRRKSITKLFTEFFSKKPKGSTGGTSKGFLSRISPKSKDKSKEKILEEPTRRKSFSEIRPFSISPPPIPPLPLNYTNCKDDSSEGESDWKKHEDSSCDTLDQSGVANGSMSSLGGRRPSRGAKKAARQVQLKRHRMAQEVQRKLEETEVKTRELEQRGVVVEKALRGEVANSDSKEESELLKEWFDLMRDLTELRRYERELMIRAQDLKLEDRHTRLQQDLRERLDNEEHKTKHDIAKESSIINEMMEIVAKRDSLIALLEEDRIRYSEEDRDFEEQMLAKGIRLTSLQKTPDQ